MSLLLSSSTERGALPASVLHAKFTVGDGVARIESNCRTPNVRSDFCVSVAGQRQHFVLKNTLLRVILVGAIGNILGDI